MLVVSARRPADKDGNLFTSVAIYIPPERSFGAGAALGDECAPALVAAPSLPGLEVGDGGTRVLR